MVCPFHLGKEAFVLARCFQGCDSKAKGILQRLGQRCTYEREGQATLGMGGVLPVPGPP